MTGEVTDRFNRLILFHLDKKQFIALQNLKVIPSQSRTLLLLGIFTDPLYRLGGMWISHVENCTISSALDLKCCNAV